MQVYWMYYFPPEEGDLFAQISLDLSKLKKQTATNMHHVSDIQVCSAKYAIKDIFEKFTEFGQADVIKVIR